MLAQVDLLFGTDAVASGDRVAAPQLLNDPVKQQSSMPRLTRSFYFLVLKDTLVMTYPLSPLTCGLAKRVSPLAILVSLFLSATAVRGETLAEGTAVELRPDGMVVRTATGDVPITFHRAMRITVRAVANIADLPEQVPCYLLGRVAPNSDEVIAGNITIFASDPGLGANSQHAMVHEKSGDISFTNVPGILKKGPPATFTAAPRVLHTTVTAEGKLYTTPGVNIIGGKTFRIPDRCSIEYDFGSNLSMAGANPKVTVAGDRNRPNNLQISVDRTEPIDVSQLQQSGKAKRK